MTVASYTRIFIGPSRSVAVSGSQIYILNSTTGEVVTSTSTIAKEIVPEQGEETQAQGKKEKGKAPNAKAGAGPIVAAAVNDDLTYLLTVKEDKMMKLWEIPELKLINERELPKRPTRLAFTKDSQTILVSDKFGDVFSYSFTFVPPQTKPTRDELSSHENPSDGHLVLGHASPVNAFVLSYDEKYIITADRDEHIRVSWYPQGYNIEMYCLGHRKYVSAIHLPSFAPDTLISGGGDPTLKIWNWMSGKCVGEVRIWEEVEPFVGVKSNKRKRGGGDGDGEEDEEGGGVQKRKGKGKKSKRRGKKGKGGKEVRDGEGENEGEGEVEADAEGGEQEVEVVEEKVLVVSTIGSAPRGDAKFVIFSAVGVTALFGFQYPTGFIEHFDFGYPVIDFAIDGEGNTWVSLDTTWSAGTVKDPRLVRVVQFNEDGKFVEGSLSTGKQTLLESLNGACATTDSLDKPLDFYADLKGMPKWSEFSAQAATAGSKEDATESLSGSATPKPLTRREEGRMKNKKNVLAKMQETVHNEAVSATAREKAGIVRPHEDVESDGEGGRETKRPKSAVEGAGDGDVEMGS